MNVEKLFTTKKFFCQSYVNNPHRCSSILVTNSTEFNTRLLYLHGMVFNFLDAIAKTFKGWVLRLKTLKIYCQFRLVPLLLKTLRLTSNKKKLTPVTCFLRRTMENTEVNQTNHCSQPSHCSTSGCILFRKYFYIFKYKRFKQFRTQPTCTCDGKDLVSRATNLEWVG